MLVDPSMYASRSLSKPRSRNEERLNNDCSPSMSCGLTPARRIESNLQRLSKFPNICFFKEQLPKNTYSH